MVRLATTDLYSIARPSDAVKEALLALVHRIPVTIGYYPLSSTSAIIIAPKTTTIDPIISSYRLIVNPLHLLEQVPKTTMFYLNLNPH